MKDLKQIVLVTVIGLALIVQLMNPTLVHAEGEITPEPSKTLIKPSTVEPKTEPTDVFTTELVVPEPLSGTPSPVEATSTHPVTDKPNLGVIDPTISTSTDELLIASPTTDPPLVMPSLPIAMPSDTASTGAVNTTIDSGTIATPTPLTDSPEFIVEPTEPAFATKDVVETPASGELPIPEKPSLPEALQELPGDTNVVVLDDNGQPLPLASQTTADIIAQADPMWCPDGVPPGGLGCTVSYQTITDLLANEGTFIDNQAVNGTIWITTGNIDDTNPITFDGSNYTNWANYNLTLQGGWSGINGDTTIGSNSIFSVPLTITNWNNGIMIQNIDAPSINLSSVTSTQGNGVSIDVNSNLRLDNIKVERALGTGLYVRTTGTITAENILSNDNQRLGLAGFPIDLRDLGSGAHFDGAGGVTLIGTNVFSGNDGSGLGVFSNESITLSNITANNNGYEGAVVGSLFGAVTFTGTNNFSHNWGSGLEVRAPWNDITLNNVTAQHNRLRGISIINIAFMGLEPSAETVTLNNVIAQYNGTGLSVYIAGTLNFSGGAFTNNEIGLYLSCVRERPKYYHPGTFITNNTTNIAIADECGGWIGWGTFSPLAPSSSTFLQGQGEVFTLNCTIVSNRYVVHLANGDRGEISCPVSGQASIDRVDNTILPASLPAGYTYSSAFDVRIAKGDEEISVIEEGGHITASFVAQPFQGGNSYSILYWDHENNVWVALKDFLLDEQGQPQSFDLYPGVARDDRKILSGVELLTTSDTPRVEVSTNFPGLFVLVQH